MMRFFLALALLASAACTDAYGSWHRRRVSRARLSQGVTDHLTGGHTWKVLWTGADTSFGAVNDSTWEDLGSDGITLTGASGAGTGDQSTSGLTLPASLTDKSVSLDSDDTWDETGAFTTIADGTDFTLRFVVKWSALVGNDFLFRYNFGSTNAIQIRAASTTNLAVRAMLNNSEAEDSFSASAYNGVWACADWVRDVDDGTTDCGGSPCGNNTVYINGTEVLNSQTGSADGALTGGGEVTLGSYTGGTNNWENEILMLGIFEGSISEATHDSEMSGAGCF